MKISEILKSRGFFSNDIRQRFKNGQIKLNGEVTNDVDLSVKFDDEGKLITQHAGDFIFDIIKGNKKFSNQLMILDFESLANSNIESELKNIISNFFILRFSKKELIILTKI